MAALYLDEDVSVDLAELLAGRGQFVATTTAERRLGAPDPHQLLYAAERGWTVITHIGDDFRLLHDAWLLWSHRWGIPKQHSGIIVVKPGARQGPSEPGNVIITLLVDRTVSLQSALYEWPRSTGWIRFSK